MPSISLQASTLFASAEVYLHKYHAFITSGRLPTLSSYSCPCCLTFRLRQADRKSCTLCPIYKHTGQHFCNGTPYVRITQLIAKAPSPPLRPPSALASALAGEYAFLIKLALKHAKTEVPQ